MKKVTSKLIAMFLAVLMVCAMLPTAAFAANWDPDDLITITVRIFNPVNGNYYVIGTDTCTKGDEKIQSDSYQIPPLSKFIGDNTYRVEKVVGNWYFPSGDSNVGANVEWSCNSSTATMTYWVSGYNPNSGSGSGSNGSDSETIGSGSRYQWTNVIRYHSNYPDGTDYVRTITYTVNSYASSVYTGSLKSHADCGFSVPDGYRLADRYWNTAANGSGTSYSTSVFSFEKGKTYDLYAQYVSNAPVGEPVTLTYMNGADVLGTLSFLKGDSVTVADCTVENTDYDFAGWATTAAGEAVYQPGDSFIINADTTLYAVWTEKPVHTHEDDNDDGYCDEDGACMHEHDDDGYCKESGCTHGENCCPKKTEKISKPGMLKTVNGQTGLNAIGTVNPGDVITFVLNSHIGEDMVEKAWNAQTGEWDGEYKLVFNDTMSGPITFKELVSVTIKGTAIDDTYYTLTPTANGFTLTVDALKAYKDGIFGDADIGVAAVVVTYTATVNADAADDAEIKNTANVNDSVDSIVSGDVDVPYTPPTPPATGGSGTALFTIFGLLMIGAAMVVLAFSRKRSTQGN